MHRWKALLLVGSLMAVVAAQATTAGAQSTSSDYKGMATKRSVDRQTATVNMGSLSPYFVGSNVQCTAGPMRTFNLQLDCDSQLPNNEPDIEVDPADPNHLIASSNDYDQCCDAFYTSFDGGKTWAVGDMSNLGPKRIGSDPVTVFSMKHKSIAIHSSLNFVCTNRAGCGEGDLVVSLSTDGGLTWGRPVQVADGEGFDVDPYQLFHDKEWIVADNNPHSPFYGRVYLTWSAFEAINGSYISSEIWEAHSDDGGRTWSAPQEISGANAALCTYQHHGAAGKCDQNQFSVPTVGPDGTVYVAFQNEQNESLWEAGEVFDNQYLLVKSTDGGETWSQPRKIIGLEDGSQDYPFNVVGRQTLSAYQMRVNSAGNIVADPHVPGRAYLVFADNRNGRHDHDNPITNTDVFVMWTEDWGQTWQGPDQVNPSLQDQWFPWIEVNPATGELGVVYHDRRRADQSVYNTTFSSGSPGNWSHLKVSTAASHPKDSWFFNAGTPNCPHCATFIGDYNNISYGSDGTAHMVWTDRRRPNTVEAFTRYLQYIFYAKVPGWEPAQETGSTGRRRFTRRRPSFSRPRREQPRPPRRSLPVEPSERKDLDAPHHQPRRLRAEPAAADRGAPARRCGPGGRPGQEERRRRPPAAAVPPRPPRAARRGPRVPPDG